jgi:hypothetical protein
LTKTQWVPPGGTTWIGVGELVNVPLPICPEVPLPHVHTWPSVSSARV